MKTLLMIIGVMSLSVAVYASCIGPYCFDDTGANIKAQVTIDGSITNSAPEGLYSRTLTQLNALAPGAAGQIVYCNNCTNSMVCVSSGTGVGAWVAVSSGSAAGAQHCQ